MTKLIFRLNEIFKDALDIQPKKWNILIISIIYDPVGYLQSVTIQLKILFQEIYKLKIDWDGTIENILPKWDSICKYLNSLQEIIINRCYYVYQFDDPIDSYYLHGFSDSWLAAYAACIYLKSVSRSGNICVIFVTAKSRVVPLKKSFTIPRLELLGNFILSKLMVTVHDSLVSEWNWYFKFLLLDWLANIISIDSSDKSRI